MNTPSPLPLAASRFLVTAGRILTTTLAVLLLVIAVALAFAWPQVVAEVADHAGTNLQGMQPGVSLVLVSAAIMLALAARMFQRLGWILNSVSEGDPFTVDNSRRLRHIGWLMIAMQIMGLLTSLAGRMLPAEHNISAGFDLSFSGLLAAFLAFVVAQLFEQARSFREDLEGTV